MEEEKNFLSRQKEDRKSHLFRAPARRRWGLVGMVVSLVVILSGLPSEGDASRGTFEIFGQLGVLEGMGALFGSLAELMPKDETTLAGILRVWAGLFVVCGLAVMVAGSVAGFGP